MKMIPNVAKFQRQLQGARESQSYEFLRMHTQFLLSCSDNFVENRSSAYTIQNSVIFHAIVKKYYQFGGFFIPQH